MERGLLAEIFQCELCGHDPTRPRPGQVGWALHAHHIMRGPLRQKSTGKRFATLVLCFWCHTERIHGNEYWPEARQLAVLKRSRPEDFDLDGYNKLKGQGPSRVTEHDIRIWEPL